MTVKQAMRNSIYHGVASLLSLVAICSTVVGCGSGLVGSTSRATIPLSTTLKLTPSTAIVQEGASVHFGLSTNGVTIADSQCIWSSGNVDLLEAQGSGTYIGKSLGSTTVSVICRGQLASAIVSITSPANPQAIKITTGGTYTGNWSSTDPNVAAVTVLTDQPVQIEDSVVTGKGDLISISGSSQAGANVTINNVTGTALDPGEAGVQRGQFVTGGNIATLSVTQCTMYGVSFGVYVAGASVNALTISRNLAFNMEDRLSDGNGGLDQNNRINGHFIQLNSTVAPNGADISWNQVIDTDGEASVEDILNFYNSHGAKDKVINVHDNYLQGAFGTGETYTFTGGGIQIDGFSDDSATATGFIEVSKNIVVETANFGISIGAGHDISVLSNRIVSCGKDTSGNWIIGLYGSALGMWNFYNSDQ